MSMWDECPFVVSIFRNRSRSSDQVALDSFICTVVSLSQVSLPCASFIQLPPEASAVASAAGRPKFFIFKGRILNFY